MLSSWNQSLVTSTLPIPPKRDAERQGPIPFQPIVPGLRRGQTLKRDQAQKVCGSRDQSTHVRH